MSILSLQRHLDETVKQRQMMSSTVQMATLQQQLVLVEKYMQREKISFDKSEVQLLFAVKQLQHDNINPFLGMCFDKSTHLYIIWGYGFRGNLMNWIFEKKDPRTAKAEKNFREAFVRDLLKVGCLSPITSLHLGTRLYPLVGYRLPRRTVPLQLLHRHSLDFENLRVRHPPDALPLEEQQHRGHRRLQASDS